MLCKHFSAFGALDKAWIPLESIHQTLRDERESLQYTSEGIRAEVVEAPWSPKDSVTGSRGWHALSTCAAGINRTLESFPRF